MANYLILSCVFPPEPVVSGRACADLACALVARGESVTVITSFPSRPSGRIYPGFVRSLYKIVKSPEYGKIIRCLTIVSSRSHMFSRLLENVSFGLTSSLRILISPRPAAIYANTWPIFSTGLLTCVAWLRRIPVVLSVQDVYPESLALQGRINDGHPVMYILKRAESVISRNSSHVIVLSEESAEIYRKDHRIESERISIIPNWQDISLIKLDIDAAAFRRRLGIPESAFLIVYGGNVGVAAGLELVFEALAMCNSMVNLRFLIAGDGSQLNISKQLANNLPQGQVIFHSPWPSKETSEVLRSANLLLLPTRGEQSRVSVPSKLITYMLSAKPVLAQALRDSETARAIHESHCGWTVKPDKPELLASSIKSICRLESRELERRGQAGRDYAMQHFNRDLCLPQVVDLLRNSAFPGEGTESL